ncbi:hypothetical protein JCM33374_g2654 [Metschnikowia sp. JCM 33374]|nr:hypothetical protein JCM33374_g2654 [Metschnikowia sp. JCM 33374]
MIMMRIISGSWYLSFIQNAQTTKRRKFFSDLEDKFRRPKFISYASCFVANLKSEDIIVEKQPAKSVDKAPAKVKVNNYSVSSFDENDGYSSSSQKKRKPQYTQAEKAAYKRQEETSQNSRRNSEVNLEEMF